MMLLFETRYSCETAIRRPNTDLDLLYKVNCEEFYKECPQE